MVTPYYVNKCVFLIPKRLLSHSMRIEDDDYWHRQLVDIYFWIFLVFIIQCGPDFCINKGIITFH